MFNSILSKYFSNLGPKISPSVLRYTSGIISACSFSTAEISRYVSKETGQNFNTSDKGLTYLLSNRNFQIDDKYWRCHINMIFDLMQEQDLIENDGRIFIQVDFTSFEDFFLILTASVIIKERSVPLYFSMRNYPKKKGQYDHKRMERAFIKGLKHVLSKKYQYIIVADRGFANDRFLEILEENAFDYLIRSNSNLKVQFYDIKGIMEAVCDKKGIYDAKIISWERDVKICRCENEKGQWHLLSNIDWLDYDGMQKAYEDRFKIEKCFQDLKSSGFDIEKSKIRKYSRYKKLLAMTMIAHALLVFLGHLIVVKLPTFLKNSLLMESVILAYFQSDEKLCSYLKSG